MKRLTKVLAIIVLGALLLSTVSLVKNRERLTSYFNASCIAFRTISSIIK